VIYIIYYGLNIKSKLYLSIYKYYINTNKSNRLKRDFYNTLPIIRDTSSLNLYNADLEDEDNAFYIEEEDNENMDELSLYLEEKRLNRQVS
jgi:hypothetical protein